MATLEQLEQALRAADAAGNTEDARRLAQAYKAQRDATERPDFSGVTSSVDTTAAKVDPGLTLIGSTGGTSVDQFQRFVDQRRASFDPAAAAAADLSNKQKRFREAPAVAQFAAGGGSRLADTAVGAGQLLGVLGDGDVSQHRQASGFLDGSGWATGGKVATDVAMLAAPGSAIARAPTLGTRLAANAALGGGLAGIQPTLGDESRLGNAATGALLGGGGQLLGEGLGALASRARAAAAADPTRQSMLQLAKDKGIPLHISQVSESKPMKALAAAAEYLPFSGAGKAGAKQQEAFNRAISKTFGADAAKLTDEVMNAARQRISDGYEQLYARNDIPLDPNAIRALVATETSLGKRLTEAEAKVVGNQLDSILTEASQTGMLTGKKYQALRSQIMKAEGPTSVGNAVKELRQALDDIAAKAVGPEDAALLKQLRGEWANLKTVRGLLTQVSGASENVRPAAVWPAIRKGSTKEMRDLARLGQTLLKNPIPDSGTAGRLLGSGVLLGGGWGTGGTALPALAGMLGTGAVAGRALNSPALGRLVSTPGAASTALSRVAPRAGLLGAPLVLGDPERAKNGN